MRALAVGCAVVVLLSAIAALSVSGQPGAPQQPAAEFVSTTGERNPWTAAPINNRPENFQFAIISDRTGGHRPGVFGRAVKKINLLQPEFVMSVGDLIEGGSEDPGQWALEWAEFETKVDQLEMPFFFCAGNHDLSNLPMTENWKRKFGRTYYDFRYRDVLFVVLNSEDPPKKGSLGFSAEQQQWFRDVLARNTDARWTFVFLHKPAWTYSSADLADSGWAEIEQALGDRKYTVFAGHKHNYEKFIRNDREYYMLATTGGSSKMRGLANGEFDHFVWVTMQDDGPVIGNLLLDGVQDSDISTGN